MTHTSTTPDARFELETLLTDVHPVTRGMVLDAYRDQILTEGAARQRAIARHLDEYGLAAVEPLLVALADAIDPTVQGMFVPARVRDAAADLLYAARATQES